jgi:mono/diheme cytochrome c family protein
MRSAPAALLALALAGCDGGDMARQDRYRPYEPSELFPTGGVAVPAVPGTVARGELERARALAERPALTEELLRRGRERYDIFCSPCHGRLGDGTGMVAGRYVPQPPSFHSERLRGVPDTYIVEVITNGYGRMYPYATRVPPADRWAIAAYVRTLQLSQHAEAALLPRELQQQLQESAP